MFNPFVSIINQLLPEPQASLLNGILFGIKTSFPKDLYQNLITTGTIHIVALSGQNISILIRIISELTLVFGRKISLLITIFSIIGFVLFVGIEPTIVRAAIMGSLSILAVYFGRQAWSLLSLFLAAGIMLIINPGWITNSGFQLSFLATLGIILFGGQPKTFYISKLTGEIKREVGINLRTTLAAQIFTLPLILWKFGRISIISPLTNIIIAPLIVPIMQLGFATGILGWILLPLGQLAAWLVWVPLTFIIYIVNLTAKVPLASISF